MGFDATFDGFLVAFARAFVFIREAGAENGTNHNTGQRVEAIIHWCGGQPGESWCCYFATMILDVLFGGNAPIPRQGACESVYEQAKKNDWLVNLESAVPGDLFLLVDDNDHAHHIGIVTVAVGDSTHPTGCGLAGNTSEDGVSSNGDGVHEHSLSTNAKHIRIVHYPRPS